VENRRHLYHARINSRLTLEQIGIRTALSPSVLRNIDNGRYDLLPSGVYARSYIRSFASAVGVDPEQALAEVEHLLPGTPDPIAAMHEARVRTPWETVSRWLTAVQHQLASLGGVSHEIAWRSWARTDWRHSPLPQRALAAVIDATLLVIVDAFLVMLVSWSSGIAVAVLLRESGWALASYCAIPIGLYFLLFGGIAGSTLGQYACHLIDPERHHPLTLPDILRRAIRH